MTHHIDNYILKRLDELAWQDKELAEKSIISKGQISKLKNSSIEKLSAETFYLVVGAFGDKFSTAISLIYPRLKDHTLNKYQQKSRNVFGVLMSKYETSINSIEEVSAKTGITEVRLHELYFRKGGLQAYELILTEKAINKEAGELFEEFYGKP